MEKYFEEIHIKWINGVTACCLRFFNDCSWNLYHCQLLVPFFCFYCKPCPFGRFIPSCPFFSFARMLVFFLFIWHDVIKIVAKSSKHLQKCFSLAAKFDINSVSKCQKINTLAKARYAHIFCKITVLKCSVKSCWETFFILFILN